MRFVQYNIAYATCLCFPHRLFTSIRFYSTIFSIHFSTITIIWYRRETWRNWIWCRIWKTIKAWTCANYERLNGRWGMRGARAHIIFNYKHGIWYSSYRWRGLRGCEQIVYQVIPRTTMHIEWSFTIAMDESMAWLGSSTYPRIRIALSAIALSHRRDKCNDELSVGRYTMRRWLLRPFVHIGQYVLQMPNMHFDDCIIRLDNGCCGACNWCILTHVDITCSSNTTHKWVYIGKMHGAELVFL